MSDDKKKQTKNATKTMTEALISFHETGAAALKSGKNPHFRSSYARNDIFTIKELKEKLAQVGLPFEEVESGSDGVICLVFATNDPEYSEEESYELH